VAITHRRYNVSDYDAVITFLRDLYQETPTAPYWLPQRFEYAEYLISPLHKDRGYSVDWKDTIYLWEDDGRIVGVVCSESPDENIFLHMRSEARNLETKMLDFAEQEIVSKIVKKNEIKVWATEGDELRENLLRNKGYTRQSDVEYLNWRDLRQELPEVVLPAGYTVHDMADEMGLDVQHKIDQVTKAFDSKSYPISVLRTLQSGPSYRKDLDLYTKHESGELTSFCTIWVDSVLNVAYIEPVATDANHRRIGLGKAMLAEGLRRLKALGVSIAYVGSAGDDRMNFYKESGFDERVACYAWKKLL